MGKKLKKQAINSGMTNLPKYTFFGKPKGLKMKFSKYKPKFVLAIRDWMRSVDPSAAEDESGGGRNNTFYLLSTQMGLYLEMPDKIAGFAVVNPDNHAMQIDIYTQNEEYVRTIVNIINDIWSDGILAHLNLQKLEKKFKVSGSDIEQAWRNFL